MKKFWTWVVAISWIVMLGSTAIVAQEPARKWTSRDNQETIEASFNSYDRKSKQVSLKTANGDLIWVDLKLLSRPDQRYVQKVRKSKDSIFGNTKSPENIDTKSSEPGEKKSRRKQRTLGKNAFGIRWTPGIENALAASEGSSGESDDRPVMWLRVLGQLDGLM